jgi:hypothetical protein
MAATRDNTVIYGLGTGEVVEIADTLLDCHEKQGRKRNFRLSLGATRHFCALPDATPTSTRA